MSTEVDHTRPHVFEERYRLYIDESGDHVFKQLDFPFHRFLCLLGCWFCNPDYQSFHVQLNEFKRKHIPHHPDEPVILHREDIVNQRGCFGRLKEEKRRASFDADLLDIIRKAEFRIVAVVIDKKALLEKYAETTAHPYHLAIGFMLQRYCGYLNHINRVGDVMAESRGGVEDRLLKDSYARVYDRGVWTKTKAQFSSKP